MAQSSRRTPAQWQRLVEQWQHSGQSAVRFCEEHHIGYASFCSWRKRLSDEPPNSGSVPSAHFVDLSALSSSNETHGWNIVLSLGNGVELRLSQD